MRGDPRLLVLVWGVVVLGAIVLLTLQDAPLPVVLALIACVPRPQVPGGKDGPTSRLRGQPS